MGILNLTPDSFSDGALYQKPALALARAQRMIDEGAEIIDVGAESTRPYTGATPVDAEEEMRRLAPLADIVRLGAPVSIDTMKAEVARWALGQGVAIVNDVWGLQRDSEMAWVVAEADANLIVMHNRDAIDPEIDIVADMVAFFERSLAIAARAGVASNRLCLDPGIGFGKTPRQSLQALARLTALAPFGLPILVGASRKRFIASVSTSTTAERIGGTLAAHLWAAQNGACILRAHDVFETAQALAIARAIEQAR